MRILSLARALAELFRREQIACFVIIVSAKTWIHLQHVQIKIRLHWIQEGKKRKKRIIFPDPSSPVLLFFFFTLCATRHRKKTRQEYYILLVLVCHVAYPFYVFFFSSLFRIAVVHHFSNVRFKNLPTASSIVVNFFLFSFLVVIIIVSRSISLQFFFILLYVDATTAAVVICTQFSKMFTWALSFPHAMLLFRGYAESTMSWALLLSLYHCICTRKLHNVERNAPIYNWIRI